MYTYHITIKIISHLNFIWLRGTVGNAQYTLLHLLEESNKEIVGSKPKLKIFFEIIYGLLWCCFVGCMYFLRLQFQIYLYILSYKMVENNL